MKAFATLLEKLILTPSRNRKLELLADYFAHTTDPDRGYALAAITRDLALRNLKGGTLKELARARVDPVLFDLSYDYVGDMAETIALIWPTHRDGTLPGVTEFIELVETTPKTRLPEVLSGLLDIASPNERWALIKLVTGGLRIGVSARLAKTALAHYSGKDLADIEKIWHGLEIPYSSLFAWLDGKREKPEIQHAKTFHPMMLAHPIDEEKDFQRIAPDDFQAEWKWDGIRVQLVFDDENRHIFSRTGDDISAAFPDIIENLNGAGVLDGELLVGHAFDPLSFNCLQQRLNRKRVVKKHLKEYPAFVRVYDILFDGDNDIRDQTLTTRRQRLEQWFLKHPQTRLDISEIIDFRDWNELGQIRAQGAEVHGHEGVMMKRKISVYEAGRPKDKWFKWKRDPKLVDAVLMYAQRGHGKRSSYYSDFTFGVWLGPEEGSGEIVPIGKAYSGFTDEELKKLDKFVRANTINSFGPVREIEKKLVVEVAFDSAHESPRHKSGIALRFPRIHRIRWDKPVNEVQTLDDFRAAFFQ
jgi:DNA ligase-1